MDISREPGKADAALEADIAAFLKEMKRWNKPPRTAALALRILADRTRDKERIGELEGEVRWALAEIEDATPEPYRSERIREARALLGEVPDAE